MKISCVMMLVVSMLAFCGCGDSRERLDINIEKGDSVVTMRLCFTHRARSWDRWHGQTRLNARREVGEKYYRVCQEYGRANSCDKGGATMCVCGVNCE